MNYQYLRNHPQVQIFSWVLCSQNILMYFFPQSSCCPIVYAYETLPLTFTEERRLTQTFHGIECSDFCLLDCDLENYYILMLIYTVM